MNNLQEAIDILNREYIHKFLTYGEGDPLEITQERLHIQIGWIEAMRTLALYQEERKRQNIPQKV